VRRGRADVRRHAWHLCVIVGLLATGCFESPEAPPSSPPSQPSPSPGPGVPISGSERIGWDQSAGDPAGPPGYTYWIYVDGTRSRLGLVDCSSSAGTAGYPCSAPLPPLSPGPHVLELSASIGSDGRLEGPRSLPFSVVVASPAGTVVGSRAASAAPTAYTAEGLTLSAEVLAEAVRPVALRFAPDGRLFVAEQEGRIRVLEDGVMQPEPALVLTDVVVGPAAGLLDMALAPDFARSHFVYVVYTTNGRDGLEKTVTRYREVSNALGEPAVLVSGIPAAIEPDSAALTFGPDGKLFVLTGQPADARVAQPDLAEGQLLRLNPDGTTPSDNPAFSPIVRRLVRRPISVVWTDDSETLLLVQGDDRDVGRGRESDRSVVWRDGDRLVVSPPPASAAICPNAAVPEFRTDVFVTEPESLGLLRLPSAQVAEPGPVPVEPLFAGQLGPVAVVACSPAGDLYVATRHLQAPPSLPDRILRIIAR